MLDVKSGDLPREGEPPHPSGAVVDPFVGRARELDLIGNAGEALGLGRGRLVVVSGEAGVGKSRFCAEVAERSRQGGARVVETRCWLDGGAPPLWPWQSVLAEVCPDGADLLAAGTHLDDVGPDRFARFVAVTDCLAKASTSGPMCLVIDDVQGADVGTLLLIRFVARSLSRFPLLLVLGRRLGEPPADSEAGRLLEEIEQDAISVVLGGFDQSETAQFLAAHGIDAPDLDLVATLFALTRGHPLHLARIVQTMGAPSSPPVVGRRGLQVAIQQAFDQLDKEPQRLLAVAAVLGPDPTVAETAAVGGVEPVVVLDAVEDGVVAGLVTPTSDGQFSFTHEFVRSTVEDHLDLTDRLQAHALASTMLVDEGGRDPQTLARAARHARQAAPRSEQDADWAVVVCEAAAQAMVTNFAYEQADELFSAAMDLYRSERLGQPDALVALQWGVAASLRGNLNDARERYACAIALATEEDRPAYVAEAALGWGGIWLDDYVTATDKARMLRLYAETLETLRSRDDRWEPVRCRLRARLVAEVTYMGSGPVEDLHDAIDATRATGDLRALAEALSLAQHALFTHEHSRTRAELNDELLEITATTDLGMLALMGPLWRAINALHLGNGQFLRSLEALREQAMALDNQHMLYHVAVMDGLVAIGQGRLGDAEEQAARSYELGERIGRVDAFAYYATQLAVVRWLQGRDAELVDQVRELAASPILGDTEFSGWAMAACLAARAGQHDQARSILSQCLPADMADLVPSGTWMAGLVALVEAAAALDDRDLAAKTYQVLLPHAGMPAVAGLGIVCLGSVERSLGLAAGVLRSHDDAVAHLERAVEANHRLLNHALLAVARADLGRALARRADAYEADDPADAAHDRERAADLLRQAIADGTTFGLTGRVTGWESELAALTRAAGATTGPASTPPLLDGTGPARPQAAAAAPAAPDGTLHPAGDAGPPDHADDRPGVIRLEGRRWLMGVGARRIRVPNLVGVRYVAELLTNPGKRIPAVMLADKLTDPVNPHRQELLDDQARSAYAARARELAADLAEAEAANDLHRAERLRAEIDLLVDQLESATGLGGRPRHFPDDHERARVAVQKAIKRAFDAVEDADPTLAELLRQTISTGVTCTYTPNAKAPATWTSHDGQAADN